MNITQIASLPFLGSDAMWVKYRAVSLRLEL